MGCTGCGAPLPSGSLVCGFCGAGQGAISDAADEIKAVQQLGQAWNALIAKKGAGSMLGSAHPMAMANTAKNFWSTAYTPTSIEGLIAAAEQSAMLIRRVTMGDVMGATMNPLMLNRMESCLDMLEIKAPGDARVSNLGALYEKKQAANGILQKMGFCFPADTRILTPRGYRTLGDLDAGDEVLSRRPDGVLVTGRISRKIDYGPSPVLSIHFEDRTLRTTVHHSLRTTTGWKRAGQLEAGDTVRCVARDGRVVESTVVSMGLGPAEPVFNLHTTGPHTFVAEGVIAHNFNKLRWLRVLWHRLVIDPFVDTDLRLDSSPSRVLAHKSPS